MFNYKLLPMLIVLALIAAVAAPGQTTTGTLSGEVRDASGAVVPNSKIIAVNASTSATRETTTDGEGRYSLTNLGPGQYELRAERTGFRTAVQKGVTLTVGGTTVVDLTVQVGALTEVVEVTGEEPLIETSRVELSRVVNQRMIESLPIIGRNFVDLSDRPGNLGRNTLTGDNLVTLDMRVAREFQLNGRVTAEFSGDFFNLLNRKNVTDLNTVYGGIDLAVPPSPLLGFNTPRDAANPFQFQYGMKLRF